MKNFNLLFKTKFKVITHQIIVLLMSSPRENNETKKKLIPSPLLSSLFALFSFGQNDHNANEDCNEIDVEPVFFEYSLFEVFWIIFFEFCDCFFEKNFNFISNQKICKPFEKIKFGKKKRFNTNLVKISQFLVDPC